MAASAYTACAAVEDALIRIESAFSSLSTLKPGDIFASPSQKASSLWYP